MKATVRDPRDRILTAAYALFSKRGVHAVGVDEIIVKAVVAKATFYRHFKSKDDLIVAFLKRRGELWTHGWLERETLKHANDPKKRMLAIFDVMDAWFKRDDFEGCPFIDVVGHVEPRGRVRKEAVNQLGAIRGFIRNLAKDAGAKDAEALASSWQTLMAGAIVMALIGNVGAARLAKTVGESLLTQI